MDGVELPGWLAPGRVFLVGRPASPQFATIRFPFRVINVDTLPTYEGWAWLEGYQLSPTTGEAIERREIFVRIGGLKEITPATGGPPVSTRAATRARPAARTTHA